MKIFIKKTDGFLAEKLLGHFSIRGPWPVLSAYEEKIFWYLEGSEIFTAIFHDPVFGGGAEDSRLDESNSHPAKLFIRNPDGLCLNDIPGFGNNLINVQRRDIFPVDLVVVPVPSQEDQVSVFIEPSQISCPEPFIRQKNRLVYIVAVIITFCDNRAAAEKLSGLSGRKVFQGMGIHDTVLCQLSRGFPVRLAV